MARYITGTIKCEISFYDVLVEDGETETDAIFPDGWEGEMISKTIDIDYEENDEEDEEEEYEEEDED